MRQMILFLCLLGLGILNGCGTQSPYLSDSSRANAQSAHTLNREVTLEIDYLLYLPNDYDATEKDWPLLVFLHGLGERGPDLNRVKKHGPAKLIETGREFPFIIVSPQCVATGWWSYETEKVITLINEITETYRVDKKRVYLTGLSMGGFGTWAVAASYPDRFAAIAPVCGGGHIFVANNLKNVPVWAFHGAKDSVVPLERSQEMVDAVNSAGGHAKLTVYPQADHNSWTETYKNEKLYEWLLSHSK